MSLKTIRWVILFGVITIIAIILSQVFWIRKGLLINQGNFDTAVEVSLDHIASRIEMENHGKRVTSNPVVRLSPHSYEVHIAEKMDLNLLDYLIRNEFSNPFHKVDFIYQVFETSRDFLVFEETVSADVENATIVYPTNLPKLTESTYYFKINFPERPIVNSVMLFVWSTSLVALTIVLVFFGFSLDVIIRQRRLSEFQQSFINNLAHEFKTPISTIGISADVITDPEIVHEPDRLMSYATIIKNENARLTGQVSKILELANLENNELVLNKETFHLNELVTEILQSFTVRLDERGGRLISEIHAKRDLITADKVHLQNVINTLLDNALKYNDKAIPEITVLTGSDDTGAFISVSDNGIGISKEFHRKIFEKFFRVPTGNIHNVKGYGLGLNYVKMIAKAHKWRLKLDSELNKGSIFTLIIPL